MHMQPLRNGGKRHAAPAQFAKHTVLYRCKIVPTLCTRSLRHLRLAVLEMDVLDAFTKAVKAIQDA